MEIVAALGDPRPDLLLGEELHGRLRGAGATFLQVNLDDEHVPSTALRLQSFAEPVTGVAVVSTSGDAASVLGALLPAAARVAAWSVETRTPLPPPPHAGGQRLDALSQVAFLRRPAELAYADWLAHWHGPHTRVAMETQATFGYVQHRVLERLTPATPPVDAVVEELFPPEAVHDVHAFYGSGGSQEELTRRITRLMGSVAAMGADRDLDVVPTSRYRFPLA